MSNRTLLYFLMIAVTVAGAGGFLASRSFSAADTTVSALAKETHFHGIAVDPSDPSRVYLATHHGLYAVAPDGSASRISSTTDDFMGFTPHPADPSILYASGHPASGGNLGFIASTDGGKSWKQLAGGVGGPVDFHQMDVSKADPKVIYGVHGGLQISKDAGRTWQMIGPAPEGLIDLAASAKDANTLYAATKGGLVKSDDGGRSWRDAFPKRQPATMVQTTPEGEVYAFIVGTGLIRASEPKLTWRQISNGLGGAYVLHLAIDPTVSRNLYAVILQPQTSEQTILTSRDGGKTWSSLETQIN